MRFSLEEKQTLVLRYNQGKSVAAICVDTGIPRSTLYSWIETEKSTEPKKIGVLQKVTSLKRKVKMLEERLEILQKTDCTVLAPLKVRLKALEKLYGQYSVHTLCDALDVAWGTFYNHIFRLNKVTTYDKRKDKDKRNGTGGI